MLKRLFGRSEEDARVAEREDAAARAGLERTRKSLGTRLAEVFGPVDITDETWEELEARLIQSDIGARTALEMVEDLRAKARYAGARRASELPDLLHQVMVKQLAGAADTREAAGDAEPGRPFVILVVGVNGSGKTTTIAKLGHHFVERGQRVLLVAGDTFRAAAIDQLQVWGQRAGAEVIAGQPGGDPGAVVYDALSSRSGKTADVVIVDTAGRLHTQHNLMAELIKVRGVISRVLPGAPQETLLVLDATTGQNGLAQARAFTEAVEVTGLVLAKLDSSAKGGVAFAVTRELGLPILYMGVGEGMDDLLPFDPERYADGILGQLG